MDLRNPDSTGVLASGNPTTVRSQTARTPQRHLREMVTVLVAHWPEYILEGLELGVFMFSACTFTVLLFHPSSPVTRNIGSESLRRVLMGLAMGITAIAIVFSPAGKRSGAHFNPAVTLTFLRLNKVKPWDAAFYTLFQFGGGIIGVVVASVTLGNLISHMTVKYAATEPGPLGSGPAFLAEIVISFVLMLTVLTISNIKALNRFTGLFAGTLVAIYISLESPISGMSMNPARTFASAAVGNIWHSLWIYFTAPPIGMLLAAEVYTRLIGRHAPRCAKLHHHNNARCIFNCDFNG